MTNIQSQMTIKLKDDSVHYYWLLSTHTHPIIYICWILLPLWCSMTLSIFFFLSHIIRKKHASIVLHKYSTFNKNRTKKIMSHYCFLNPSLYSILGHDKYIRFNRNNISKHFNISLILYTLNFQLSFYRCS
jgi:hypothetical protein